MCVWQFLVQRNKDVAVQNSLKNLFENEQRRNEQVCADKQQLEAELRWIHERASSEERAYRVLKRNMKPWVLRMRLRKMVRSGDLSKFRTESKKRDCKIMDIIYLLSAYSKQLRVMSEKYCVPMEAFFQKQAYSPMDPDGFYLINFQSYARAVDEIVQVYTQVETEVNKLKGVEAHGIGNVDIVLIDQIERMWSSRGGCAKMMNRQRNVNDAVRIFQRADKSFSSKMDDIKQECKELEISAGFDYMSG